MARLIPERLKRRLSELPGLPGVYFFKNAEGRAIYIGKALSIKKRVGGHFRFYGETFSKEGIMLGQTERVDYIETPNEAEALLLEASLVKESMPKYNALLKDDKSYPYLKITGEEYPRLLIVRGRKADGGKYFGPYTSGRLLHQAVKMLRREYPLRTCRTMPKKLCLQYHLQLCGGPCDGSQAKEAYLATAKELERFLEGKRDALVKNLSRRMKAHAAKKEYEEAKALFEEIRALKAAPSPSPRFESAVPMEILRDALALPVLPARVECFDISNIHGKEAVGSMVVFIDGKPARSEYRRFRIKTVSGIDDYRMMQEVVRRRYARVLDEKTPLPDLIVIDGGKGHLAAAKKELDALGLEGQPVISIAKQHEWLYKPGESDPHILSPTSPALHLVRHLRDEAHRFAITYHRRLHKKEALVSSLDKIPGVGPKTKERLLRRIGSVSRICRSTQEELVEKGGVNAPTARRILEALAPEKRVKTP